MVLIMNSDSKLMLWLLFKKHPRLMFLECLELVNSLYMVWSPGLESTNQFNVKILVLNLIVDPLQANFLPILF